MSIRQVLARTPAFTSVEPEVLSELAAVASSCTVSRRRRIWDADDLPRFFVVVSTGIVKVSRTSSGGRTVTYGLVGAPDSIGELAVLDGHPYPSTAVAVTDVDLILIPRKALLSALRTSACLGSALAYHAQNTMQNLLHAIDVLSAGSVEARLASVLLWLYEKFGDDFDDGSSEIPVALSRQELADLACTSQETAIRVMTRWQRSETVCTHSRGFMIRSLTQLRSACRELS